MRRIDENRGLSGGRIGFRSGGAFSSARGGRGGQGRCMMEKPMAAEEKKEEAPTTCGPLISDSCIPIETGHASLQVLGALSFYTANFSPNWRRVSTKGDFYTFNLPVKFTYGPTKDLEMYVIAPFIVNWANNLDRGAAGPNGERSANYSGIGDITAVSQIFAVAGKRYPARGHGGGRGGCSQRPRLPPQSRPFWARMPSAPGPSTSSPASTCTSG